MKINKLYLILVIVACLLTFTVSAEEKENAQKETAKYCYMEKFSYDSNLKVKRCYEVYKSQNQVDPNTIHHPHKVFRDANNLDNYQKTNVEDSIYNKHK